MSDGTATQLTHDIWWSGNAAYKNSMHDWGTSITGPNTSISLADEELLITASKMLKECDEKII